MLEISYKQVRTSDMSIADELDGENLIRTLPAAQQTILARYVAHAIHHGDHIAQLAQERDWANDQICEMQREINQADERAVVAERAKERLDEQLACADETIAELRRALEAAQESIAQHDRALQEAEVRGYQRGLAEKAA